MKRKKTVRGTVFADVGNECEARGEGGVAAEKSLAARHGKEFRNP